MEKEIVTGYHWFWAWEDEKEENWLGEMSARGWHLESLGFPGIYHFKCGEPRPFVYRMDFNSPRLNNREEYFRLFSDSGWEYIGKQGGWKYFRKEKNPGETSEIFTDRDSKADKYRRLLAYLACLLPLMILLLTRSGNDNFHLAGWWEVIKGVSFALYIIYIYALVKIWLRIRQLKKG